MKIVGVHGIGHYVPGADLATARAHLAGQWARSLATQGFPVDLAMAYYAGYLHVTAQGDELAELTGTARAMLDAWAAHLDVGDGGLAQASWSVPARMLVDRIARRRALDPVLLRRFVATFLREAEAYLRAPDAPARIAAREEVARTIGAHRPDVVIAHSLGSVVAYEALWAHPELRTDLLVTVGSPLGMTGVVFDRLVPAPAGGAGLAPPNVGRWVNVADPGDLVAVPRPLTARFRLDENHEDEHIHWLDFHSARRYLSAAPTLRALRTLALTER